MKRIHSYLRLDPTETYFSSKEPSLASVSLEDVLGLLRETANSSLEPENEVRFWTLRADLIQLATEWYSLTSKVLTAETDWSRSHLLFLSFLKEVEKTLSVSELTLERSLGNTHGSHTFRTEPSDSEGSQRK